MEFERSDIDPAGSYCIYDPVFTIPELFVAQVRDRSTHVAIIEDDRKISYGDLARIVLQLSACLRVSGVARGDRVAILSPRGIETVAAQLAILSVGAAFVPLDPAAPGTQHLDVLEQADIRLILSHPGAVAAAERLADHRQGMIVRIIGTEAAELDTRAAATSLRLLIHDPATFVRAEDLAYVIFTSGSTGRPKGVMIPHRGVCRLVRGQDFADFGPDQVVLNLAAVGFDAGIVEIYSALLNGGTLAILPDATPSLDRIAEVLVRDAVTTAHITAGLFHVIAEHRPEILAPLKQVFPCGDVLSGPHVARVRERLPNLRITNGYGPTENTVGTCFHTLDASWTGGPVPIGRGIAHDRLFVLDEALEPVADGQIGQLAVGGQGIALGYLGRPDLTEAAFVPLRTGDFDGPVYLTGDLVRRDAEGVVHFHGRADRQVKVNGQRVELDAVEHALRALDAVEDAAAVALDRPGGGKRIVAFIKPDGVYDPDGVSEGLRDRLPKAAIPSEFHLREAFPLNASGKVDRKALAATLVQAAAPSAAQAQGLRQQIRRAWEAELGHAVLDESRSFFENGGTSLQLVAVHARLQTVLGRAFDIAKLFEAPRIDALDRLLSAQDGEDGGIQTVDPVAASRVAMARARGRRRVAR